MGYHIKDQPAPSGGPKSVLKEGVIYYGDNGRTLCIHCAGVCASSGYDTSGQKVVAATLADKEAYLDLIENHPVYKEILGHKKTFSCECGKTSY